MTRGFSITAAPAVEPLSLADAKAHLRIEHSADDTYITALIAVARQMVEEQTGLTLINTTYLQTLSEFPESDIIELVRPPLQSVSSLKYIASDGTLTTISASDYIVDTQTQPGTVRPAYGKIWPCPQAGHPNGVQVTFVAGFGASAANVPALIVHALKFLVAHFYERREPVTVGGTVIEMPFSVKSIINTVQVWRG